MAHKTPRCTCPPDGKLVFLGHLKTCPEIADQAPLTLQTLLDRGLPYSRLDRWARAGHLNPHHQGGTGNNRHWPQTELQVAAVMWQLVEGGLAAGVAALTARRAIHTRQPVTLAPGITLHVDVDQLTGGTA